MGLSSSNIKKFLIFSQRKAGNGNPEKNSFYFKKQNFLLFWEITFQARKNKKNSLLYFGNWNFLVTSLKNFLYFSRELEKPEKQKFHIFCLLRENFSNISTKEKSFL